MTMVGNLIATALLAAGFAAVGETAMGRRSRDLVSWNESFLAGLGIAAALLFPLSLLLPENALPAEAALLAAGLLVRATRGLSGDRKARATRAGRAGWNLLDASLFLAIVLVAAAFTAVDLRYTLLWDGFQIWASKSQLLYVQGGLGSSWYPGDSYELRHLAYPAAVSLFQALLALLRGGFDFDAFKPVFLPLYYSTLFGTFAAARSLTTRRTALAATLVLALAPEVTAGHAFGGYADMPQAAFVAGVASASLRGDGGRRALPWLIGGLTTVKSEGIVLAAAACAAVVLSRVLETPRPRRLGDFPVSAVAIVASFFGLRFAFLRWVGAPDTVYALDAAHLARAVRLVPHVARMCLVKALSPRRWGPFWLAFAAAGLTVALRGSPREKGLVAAIVASAATFAAIFLFTTWPLDLHIDQAYPRLLAQLAPAAAVVLALGYARARGAAAESPDPRR